MLSMSSLSTASRSSFKVFGIVSSSTIELDHFERRAAKPKNELDGQRFEVYSLQQSLASSSSLYISWHSPHLKRISRSSSITGMKFSQSGHSNPLTFSIFIGLLLRRNEVKGVGLRKTVACSLNAGLHDND